jgi:hypothetical protein
MTRKVYRTAQGKMVDLGALQLQNETVRAVGNMNVNARGDLVDGMNRPISSKNQQVAKQYNKQTSNVSNESIYANKIKKVVADIPLPPEDFEDDFDAASVLAKQNKQ